VPDWSAEDYAYRSCEKAIKAVDRGAGSFSGAAALPTEPPPPLVKVDRRRVAKYLRSLSKLMAGTEDQGKALVQSLVEHHGLEVRMQDASTLVVSLRLRPPGSEAEQAAEYAVALEGEARLKADTITQWVDDNQGKHKCKCGCGRTVEVIRRHYWRGVPQFHADCRHKGMQRKRAELAKGYYSGQQAAERLGIGRTTLGRWIRAGKLPKPTKSISGMLLFGRTIADRTALRQGRARRTR